MLQRPSGNNPSKNKPANNDSPKGDRRKKKKKDPTIEPVVWTDDLFDPEPLELSSPNYIPINTVGWDSFKYIEQYLDDEIFQLIVDKTNQTNVKKKQVKHSLLFLSSKLGLERHS